MRHGYGIVVGLVVPILLLWAGWLWLRPAALPPPAAGPAIGVVSRATPPTPPSTPIHTAPAGQPSAMANFTAAICQHAQVRTVLGGAPGPDVDLSGLWQQANGEAARATLATFLQQTSSTGNPSQQAAAWLVRAQWQAQQLRQGYLRSHPNCANEVECGERTRESAARAGMAEAQNIARLAVNSPDPLLYATAFHACRKFVADNSGFCQQISATQWAARDPDNGIAWLHVLSGAGQTGQGQLNSEGEDALFRLSQASRFDQGLSHLPQLRSGSPALQQNGLAQLALIQLNNALYHDLALPTYGRVSNYCNPDKLIDVNRRQMCESIANKLVSDQSSLLGFAIGAAMGQRLGWPAQRLAVMQQERDAFQGFLLETADLPNAPPEAACRKRMDAAVRLENSMQNGEMAEFRRRVANTPGALAQWAARYRASQVKDTAKK
jgi:hypothetical protein